MNSTSESSAQAQPGRADPLRELALLEALAENPEARQVDLATRLGVAVGTVNWLVKRMSSKGLLKVKRLGRWRWSYLVTPQGLMRKAHLTQQYVHASMQLYRATREQARSALDQVKRSRYTAVRVDGALGDDLVDVCRLTCLEQGIHVVSEGEAEKADGIPRVRVHDRTVSLEWPKGEGRG